MVWVNVSETISSSVDYTFLMYYGNSGASAGESATDVWHSDFEAVYHMDGSTSTAYDSTGNHHGTKTAYLSGTPVQASGFIGYGQDFEGTNKQYIDIGDLTIDTSDTFTMSCFVKPEQIDNNHQYIIGINDGTNKEFIWMIRSSSDPERHNSIYTYGAIAGYTYGNTVLVGGTWQMIAFAIDGTTVANYVNKTTQTDTTLPSDIVPKSEAWLIGERLDNNAYPYDGVMDEFRISNVQFSSSWMHATFDTCSQTAGFMTLGSEQDAPAGTTLPVVTTDDATGVEETNATVRGTLTNNGSADTTCYFIWGDETPPTDHNDTQGVIAHQASFSQDCTSLSEGTLYYFYTKASNSEGWDEEGAGGIKSFLTKPDPPTSASVIWADDGTSDWYNLSWTAGSGADKYYVRYSTTATPTTRSEGSFLCNVTTNYYNTTFSSTGTYYFSIWSYAYESSPALHQFSDTYDSASKYLSFYTWHSEDFGGKLTVTEPTPAIDVELNTSSWIAGSLDCGEDVQKNFTFYQNGSANIDISIGINSTNGNYSFVNYSTYSSNGHDQYCANFTVNTWSTEDMIEPGYPATSILNNDFSPGNFAFGIRLWMPKSVSYQDKKEDFEVVLFVSEST